MLIKIAICIIYCLKDKIYLEGTLQLFAGECREGQERVSVVRQVGWGFGVATLGVCQYLKINQLPSSQKKGLPCPFQQIMIRCKSTKHTVQLSALLNETFPIEFPRIHIRTVVIYTKSPQTAKPIFAFTFPSTRSNLLYPQRQEVLCKRINIIKTQMICFGSGLDFSCNWQLAYEQLLALYSQMNADFQRARETGVILTEKVEAITKENQEIRSKKMIKTFQTIPNPIVPSFTSLSHLEPEITIKTTKKSPELPRNSQRIRKLNSIETSQGNYYECSYQGCGRIYQSSVSLNLHIKIKHNGGTKKEREEYAKMVIDAEERGAKAPHVPIDFPPNFLQEFRTTYSYMKKYSM